MTSGRQIDDPFYAYVGWGVILLVELFWLLQMISPSAFLWGALLLQLGPPLQVLYVVFISLVETESL